MAKTNIKFHILSFEIYPKEFSQTGLNTCFWTEIMSTMRTLE